MNYIRYKLSSFEFVRYTVEYLTLISVISLLFYDSIYAVFVLIVFLPVYLKKKSNSLLEKRKAELIKEFCVMIESLSTVLTAGCSVEKAFYIVRDEMEKIYGKDSLIYAEISEIVKGLDVNKTVATSLVEFSKRTRGEDIKNFVDVFCEAMRTGGNLNEIIRNTVIILQDKRRIEEEIEAMLKGKMLEQKIMSIIPFLIFTYLKLSSGEFIDVLYHNPVGILVMSICLIIYVSSVFISEKIVRIKV